MAFDESTIADALDEFQCNRDWFSADSFTKAQAFEAACVTLLMLPKSGEHAEDRLAFDPMIIERELSRVRNWIETNRYRFTETSDIGAVHFDLSDSRNW